MWDPARDETPPRRPPSHSSMPGHPPARRHSRDYIHDNTKFEGHNILPVSSDHHHHSVPPGDSVFTATASHGSAPEAIDTLMYHVDDSFWEDAPDMQAQKLDTSNHSQISNHIPLEQSFTTLQTHDDFAPGMAIASGSMNIPTQSTSTAPAGSPLSPSPRMPQQGTAQCVAHLFIPQSHRSQFVAALAAPPDLALKIKKSVRFRREPSSTSKRRGAESPVAFSSIKSSSLSKSLPGSSVKSASPRFAHGGVGICDNSSNSNSSSSLKAYGASIVEKDPEEKVAELMELKQMKIRQEDLFHLKDQIIHLSQNLEDKESILDEVRVERKSLQSELARYIAMVKQIQRDVELATQAEVELSKEREQLSQQVSQLKDNDYKILKEEVDQLRSKKGLRPLPSLEQEQADVMGRYLEQRRGQWRQDGLLQEYAGGTANSIHHSGGFSSTAGTSSSAGATSTGRSSNLPSGSGPGSNSGPGPVSRSSPRATTSSSTSLTSRTRNHSARSEKNVQQSDPRQNRNTSSSSASRSSKSQTTRSSTVKPSMATSRSSGRQSQRSSPSSSRSRSQSPSVRSSSGSAAERSKKRSRY